MPLEVKRVSQINLAFFIGLVNGIFEDYKLPIKWDLLGFELDARENSVVLSESFVFYEGEQAVGFVLVARRRNRARIDAMGVIPERRGLGVAHYMLDYTFEHLRWRGVALVSLEVLEDDLRARKFYKKYGFTDRRRLVNYVKHPDTSIHPETKGVQEVDARWVHEKALRAQLVFSRKPNWQREPVTLLLANGRYRMLKLADLGYLVWGSNKDGAFIVDVAPLNETHTFHEVLGKALSCIYGSVGRVPVSIANLPEDDPLSEAVVNAGFTPLFNQIEMCYNLH